MALIRALLECDSIGQVYIKNLLDYQAGNRLKPPEINLRNNVLTVISQSDSMQIYLTLKDRYMEKQTDDKTTEYRYINVLSRWQKMRLWFANILMIILPVAGILYIKFNFIKK